MPFVCCALFLQGGWGSNTDLLEALNNAYMGHIRGKREQVRDEHLLNVNCKLTLALIWQQEISKIEKKKKWRVLTKKVYIQIKKISQIFTCCYLFNTSQNMYNIALYKAKSAYKLFYTPEWKEALSYSKVSCSRTQHNVLSQISNPDSSLHSWCHIDKRTS